MMCTLKDICNLTINVDFLWQMNTHLMYILKRQLCQTFECIFYYMPVLLTFFAPDSKTCDLCLLQ